MGSHFQIEDMRHKLWQFDKLGIKLPKWPLIIKSYDKGVKSIQI